MNEEARESIIPLFFTLIKCGIGTEEKLPCVPSREQWDELYDIACKQTLQGIAFCGIERIPAEQRPYKELMFKWFHIVEEIKKKNRELNKTATIISRKFADEGFRSCILKGQGIAMYYANPELRVPGDIDIWIEGGFKKVYRYIKNICPEVRPTYHHVDFPVNPHVEIEVHFTPTWMNSPIKNRWLQNFFSKCSEEQFGNNPASQCDAFHSPATAFNRVYILLHIYRHFQEGIGMRQMLDYYYILAAGATEEEKRSFIQTIKRLGMMKFAAAVMYAMQQMFSIDEKFLLVAPNKAEGEFLIREIMIAGNFGKYDHRYKALSKENDFKHFTNSLRRMSRLIRHYPSEFLWSPYFKVWHYFWRKSKK